METRELTTLLTLYYEEAPDPKNPLERVAFGTSGHRGTSLRRTFNEAHVLALAQAVADLRASFGATGPLFLAKDTHALSEPAWATALRVFVANGLEVRVEADGAYTPTPLVSLAILEHNARHPAKADGVLLTPSQPPGGRGLQVQPPHGGPRGRPGDPGPGGAGQRPAGRGAQRGAARPPGRGPGPGGAL